LVGILQVSSELCNKNFVTIFFLCSWEVIVIAYILFAYAVKPWKIFIICHALGLCS